MAVSISFESFKDQTLDDYAIAVYSREISILGRREVMQGKAGFGIFGDGKEVPQVVLAKYFQHGDFLSGYYRDQTICFAKGIITGTQFFSQLYADTEQGHEPSSGGRQMNAHFSTPLVDEHGEWRQLSNRYNICSYVSQTAGQMPKSIGIAYSSKIFKAIKKIDEEGKLSKKGREICFCTIGDASTAEGHFWETVHTAAVLQVPLAIFIWDDGYGISVPSSEQLVKGSISEALRGFARSDADTHNKEKALDVYTIKGWDYADLHIQIEKGLENVRKKHTPCVFHIQELTQPLGHSSSGSHERYKSAKRLRWEKKFDCNVKMRQWIIDSNIASDATLKEIETQQQKKAIEDQQRAKTLYQKPVVSQASGVVEKVTSVMNGITDEEQRTMLLDVMKDFDTSKVIYRYETERCVAQLLRVMRKCNASNSALEALYTSLKEDNYNRYNKGLYTEVKSAADVSVELPKYDGNQSELVSAHTILNQYFDYLLANNPKVFAFGEDVGQIGGVNQGFANLQKKYGTNRIFDTGIRELTIVGQAMGMALRGLRPIAEIQYIDYLLYGLQPLSDDAATLCYRSAGTQSCPIIIRSRGHRFEGIWHSGSPMSLIHSALRGFMVGVPRNMTQAVALYNALFQSNDPGLIIEPLNGYRHKERLPSNLTKVCLPFGVCEVMQTGSDVTIVSYGSTLRFVMESAEVVKKLYNVSCEIIDIQTILPFDTKNIVLASLKKTNRILFVDEDYDGGYTSYMMQEIIDRRGGFYELDATPRALGAKPHRTSYGRDGEYYGKPNVDSICDAIMQVVEE